MREFRKIVGFERYSVSNDGIVINNISGKELSQREASNGYLRVNLRTGLKKYEKPKVRSVHRLVAEAFLPRIEGKTCVNHKDGNKHNNTVSNLEWCTPRENTFHAIASGLMSPDYKAMNRMSYENSKKSHQTMEYRTKMQKINFEKGSTRPVLQVSIDTGEVIEKFDNCHEAARALFGINSKNKDRLISRCARGKCRTAYGFKWIYEGGDGPHEFK